MTESLAIEGGSPVRTAPMPPRRALGTDEARMVQAALDWYRERDVDPGYQGEFERRYTEAFTSFMGAGHADAVSSGTSALYIALATFGLERGSEVLVSPITDPGTLSAIILNGLVPRLIDCRPDSYNIGLAQLLERVTPRTRAVVAVHAAGEPCPIAEIVAAANASDILVLEDCSQAHGATLGGRPVGSFGDLAAFSTMYRKAHMTGARGGVVYTVDEGLHRLALAHADRGKPRWQVDFDDRDPNGFLFPALNHHSDELSCAIGLASLRRLPETIRRRMAFVADFTERLRVASQRIRAYPLPAGASPFFLPVVVDAAIPARKLAEAVLAEGIGLNPYYRYIAADWPWVRPHLSDRFDTPNARAIRDRSFNLYLNENYGAQEAADAVAAIVKVERAFAGR